MEYTNQFGKKVSYERTKRGISTEKLCAGLCSNSFLHRMENGERVCEKILADALLQRMGVSAERFVFVMNMEEQEWPLVRERWIQAIERGEEEAFWKYREEYIKITKGKNKLHCQFIILAETVWDWKKNGANAYNRSSIQESWSITMGNTLMTMAAGSLMSLTELILLMMYGRISEDMGESREAMAVYGQALQHLQDFVDERDRVRLFPQIAFRQVLQLRGGGKMKEAAGLTEETITLLKNGGRLYYIRRFLEMQSVFAEEKYGWKDMPEQVKCKQMENRHICQALKWLYDTYEEEEESWVWHIACYGMEDAELCRDIIRSRRTVLGLSQAELSEGICDPVTISRIECGKTKPKRKIQEKLMKRLGIGGESFIAIHQVEHPELAELANKISVLLNRGASAQAEELFQQLERQVKSDSKYVKQYMLNMKAVILYNMKKISAREHIVLQHEALYMTLPEIETERLRDWCFSRQESTIINCMTHSYEKLGKREEIIQWLEILKVSYENKPFPLEYYAAAYELTMRNLGDLLGNAGEYERAIEASDISIKMGIKTGRGIMARLSLYDRGWDMEQLWEKGTYTKEESLQYMKASYAVSKLFSSDRINDFIRKHIRNCYTDETI